MYLQRGLDISAQWSIVRTQPSKLPLPLSVQEKYKETVAGLTGSGHQSGQLAVTGKVWSRVVNSQLIKAIRAEVLQFSIF